MADRDIEQTADQFPFSIEVESGPVQGVLMQNGQRLDNWDQLDLAKPWFWAPPAPANPLGPSHSWGPGWTTLGATIDDG